MAGNGWHPNFRAAVIAAGLDPEDAFTMAEAAARTGLSEKLIGRGARRAPLRAVKVGRSRVTTTAWLRAWLEVWYPEHAERA